MPTAQRERPKRGTLNLRIKPELRGLIDRAAALSGRNRTDFVLDAARRLRRMRFSTAPFSLLIRRPMPSL